MVVYINNPLAFCQISTLSVAEAQSLMPLSLGTCQSEAGASAFIEDGVCSLGPQTLWDRGFIRYLSPKAQPYRPDFWKLGMPISPAELPKNPARENTRLYLRSCHIAKGTLRLPEKDAPCLKVLREIEAAAGLEKNSLELLVIEDYAPNAFWVRGTHTVYVTTGLLEKPNLTRGQLAHVLGHEVGHLLLYRPDLKVPERFKNPLFRQFMLESLAAGHQMEEYLSDEVGLILTDAAGYSVNEALEMEEWLAKIGGEKELQPTTEGQKILRPGKSHPHGASRAGAVRKLIEDPRYVWRNRETARATLPFTATQFATPEEKVTKFSNSLDPLDPVTITEISRNPQYRNILLDKTNSVAILCQFSKDKKIPADEKTALALIRLRETAGQGDLIARAFFQALVSKLYYNDMGPRVLDWLSTTCGISSDEVILSLVSVAKSMSATNNRSPYPDGDFFSCSQPSGRFKLPSIIAPFPRSSPRDQLIGALLQFPKAIKDRATYLDASGQLTLPMDLIHFKRKGFKALVQALSSPSIIALKEYEFDYDDEEIVWNYDTDINEWTHADYSLNRNLSSLILYLQENAGATDRGEVERLLYESSSFMTSTHGAEVAYLEFHPFYKTFDQRAQEFADQDPVLGERLRAFARLYVLRHLEPLPAEQWSTTIVDLIASMPPSTERNHLLILLDRAGRRPVDDSELVFHDIPSPDDPSSSGSHLSLHHSFGFIDSDEAEGIYPSGQRVLDRFMADRLPKDGALTLDQVFQAIPRPSPIRDELLQRCDANNSDAARTLLDSFWSPTEAYAKAHQLTEGWLNSPLTAIRPGALSREGRGDAALADILEITGEFPSLRRRMMVAWTDRFGIRADDQRLFLKAIRDVDVVDLYRGGVVEHTRTAPRLAKASLVLSSFASALSKGSYALLSLQDMEHPNEMQDNKFLPFSNYHPLLPEQGPNLVAVLDQEKPYSFHRVPFVDGKPLPNPRFQRNRFAQEGLEELGRWEGGRSFSNFMKAMGWEEATAFYEQLLLGKDGVLHDQDLFIKIEGIFVEGISLLLEEKGVPLSRVQNIKQSFQTLMNHLPWNIRGQSWARILAGIAQEQSLGEIVREAARPLGPAGAKLMQAIHSLTVGVDATLEEATRLALDQTASFSLMDGLQFLGARGFNAFSYHDRYSLLGQGSVRAAIQGTGGPREDSAYLLVHARPSPPDVVRGIGGFIDDIVKQGQYFPLTKRQFCSLVDQAHEERSDGFANHDRFRERNGGQSGNLRIPEIYDQHGDWARMELAGGVAYSALSDDSRRAVAPRVLAGAFAQFQKVDEDGMVLINPEMHGGNILYDASQDQAWLVDCGLIGSAKPGDLAALLQIHSGFTAQGLAGATATLLQAQQIESFSQLEDSKRTELLSGIKVLDGQLQSGTSAALLLPGLTTLVARSVGQATSPGLDLLFRGLQHLAPYFRDLDPSMAGLMPSSSNTSVSNLASEIEKARHGEGAQPTARLLPKGIGLGQMRPDGAVLSIGTLAQEMAPSKVETSGPMTGMLILHFESGRRFIRPENLRIQTVGEKGQTQWVSLDEFLKRPN